MESEFYINLLKKVFQLSKQAWSPYSKIQVAAILITEDNLLFEGVNVENSSYGLTICAERNAIGHAIAHGYRNFKHIFLYSPQIPNILPCGACRQVLAEFNPSIPIITSDSNFNFQIIQLNEIFPSYFSLTNYSN